MADAVPGVEAATTSVQAELRIFVGKDLRLAGPKRVSYLQAVGGVGGAKLAGLDEEGEETCDEQEQVDRMIEAAHWSIWYFRRWALTCLRRTELRVASDLALRCSQEFEAD